MVEVMEQQLTVQLKGSMKLRERRSLRKMTSLYLRPSSKGKRKLANRKGREEWRDFKRVDRLKSKFISSLFHLLPSLHA